jgi:hypothetical protein
MAQLPFSMSAQCPEADVTVRSPRRPTRFIDGFAFLTFQKNGSTNVTLLPKADISLESAYSALFRRMLGYPQIQLRNV